MGCSFAGSAVILSRSMDSLQDRGYFGLMGHFSFIQTTLSLFVCVLSCFHIANTPVWWLCDIFCRKLFLEIVLCLIKNSDSVFQCLPRMNASKRGSWNIRTCTVSSPGNPDLQGSHNSEFCMIQYLRQRCNSFLFISLHTLFHDAYSRTGQRND